MRKAVQGCDWRLPRYSTSGPLLLCVYCMFCELLNPSLMSSALIVFGQAFSIFLLLLIEFWFLQQFLLRVWWWGTLDLKAKSTYCFVQLSLHFEKCTSAHKSPVTSQQRPNPFLEYSNVGYYLGIDVLLSYLPVFDCGVCCLYWETLLCLIMWDVGKTCFISLNNGVI